MVLPGALYAACHWAQVQLRKCVAANSLFSCHFSDIISIQSIRNPSNPLQKKKKFTSKNKGKCVFPIGISSYPKMKPITQWLPIALKNPHYTNLRRAQTFLLKFTFLLILKPPPWPITWSLRYFLSSVLADTMAASSLSYTEGAE